MLRTRVQLSAPAITGDAVSTMYWSGTGDSQAQSVMEPLADFWDAVILAVCGGSLEVAIEPLVDEVDPATGQVTAQYGVTPGTITASNTGATLAQSTQMLIQWNTGMYANGRRIVGRTYIPCIRDSQLGAAGRPSSNAVSGLASAAGALVVSASAVLEVYSRTHSLHPNVQSATVSNEFAVLRSRRD